MTKLSVIIITFNEERNIGRCLQSVKEIADEIIVVDSFSTDETQNICEQFGAKFISEKWRGYSAQKNFANSLASNNWILSIDADEAISEELKNSIKKWKSQGATPVSYTHLRAHETPEHLVCRLLLEKKKKQTRITSNGET